MMTRAFDPSSVCCISSDDLRQTSSSKASAKLRPAAFLLLALTLFSGLPAASLSAAEPATAQQLLDAYSVFKDPTATNARVVDSVGLLLANARNPAMPQEVKTNWWIVPEAQGVIDRQALINNHLHALYNGLKQGGVDFSNPTHIQQIRGRGYLDYRAQFPASGGFLQYPGLNEVYWNNLAKYEAEAIQLFVAGKKAVPLPQPRTAAKPEVPAPAVPAPQPKQPAGASAEEVATTAPPQPAPATFKADDGEDAARAYLAGKGLSDKKGIWVLAAEDDLTAKIKEAVKLKAAFSKAKKQVAKNEEIRPRYDFHEAKLKKEIKGLTDHINKNWFQANTAQKEKRTKLQQQIKKEVTPFRQKCEKDNALVDSTYEKCETLITTAEEQFHKIGEQYGDLSAEESLFEALDVVGGEIGPSANLNNQYRKLTKLRQTLEKQASR